MRMSEHLAKTVLPQIGHGVEECGSDQCIESLQNHEIEGALQYF